MQIAICTTTNVNFKLDVTPEMTVGELREAITAHEQFPKGVAPETIKLIYFGTFLDNNALTIAEAGVQPGMKVIVYMPKAPRPTAPTPAATVPTAPQAPAVSTTPAIPIVAPTPAPVVPAHPEPVQPLPSPPVPSPAPAPPQPQQPAASTSSPAPSGADPSAVAQLVEMGFDRSDATRALEAAENDVNLAVEFITSGDIPDPAAMRAARQRASGVASSGARQTGSGGTSEMGELGGADLGGISPVVAAVLQQPELMVQILQKIAVENPQVYAQIQAQPDLIVPVLQMMLTGIGGAGGSAGGRSRPPAKLLPEDEPTITEISDMTGLSPELVRPVFLQLQKDSNMTCNYILDHADEIRARNITAEAATTGGSGASGEAGSAWHAEETSEESEGSDEDEDEEDYGFGNM